VIFGLHAEHGANLGFWARMEPTWDMEPTWVCGVELVIFGLHAEHGANLGEPTWLPVLGTLSC
jgi:hypothetical protein